MSRKTKIIASVTAICIVVGTIAVVVACIVNVLSPVVLSEATSPDGRWSITVIAEPNWAGGYEIVVRVKDASGRVAPTGSFVIGLTSDLEWAKQNYVVTFDSNEVARIGNDRVIERSRYFR